jgi:hypothetical protein
VEFSDFDSGGLFCSLFATGFCVSFTTGFEAGTTGFEVDFCDLFFGINLSGIACEKLTLQKLPMQTSSKKYLIITYQELNCNNFFETYFFSHWYLL